MKYEIDPEYLFSPVNGHGKSERAVVESFFKVNYTHRFNVGRITRPGKRERKEIEKVLGVIGNLLTLFRWSDRTINFTAQKQCINPRSQSESSNFDELIMNHQSWYVEQPAMFWRVLTHHPAKKKQANYSHASTRNKQSPIKLQARQQVYHIQS